MKKLLFCLTVLAMGSWLTACKDDDDDGDTKVANEFKVGDNTYALSDAYVDSVSTTTVGDKVLHLYRIVIASNGITYNDESKFQGSGDAVRFEIQTSQNGTVPSATYLPGAGDNILKDAIVFTGYGTDAAKIYDNEITDGELTVSKSGDSHVFNFTLTLEDDSKVTGSFKGEAMLVDSF